MVITHNRRRVKDQGLVMLEREGKNQDSTRCLLCQDLLIAPAALFSVFVIEGFHTNYWSQPPFVHVDLKTLVTRNKKKQVTMEERSRQRSLCGVWWMTSWMSKNRLQSPGDKHELSLGSLIIFFIRDLSFFKHWSLGTKSRHDCLPLSLADYG